MEVTSAISFWQFVVLLVVAVLGSALGPWVRQGLVVVILFLWNQRRAQWLARTMTILSLVAALVSLLSAVQDVLEIFNHRTIRQQEQIQQLRDQIQMLAENQQQTLEIIDTLVVGQTDIRSELRPSP